MWYLINLNLSTLAKPPTALDPANVDVVPLSPTSISVSWTCCTNSKSVRRKIGIVMINLFFRITRSFTPTIHRYLATNGCTKRLLAEIVSDSLSRSNRFLPCLIFCFNFCRTFQLNTNIPFVWWQQLKQAIKQRWKWMTIVPPFISTKVIAWL